MTTIPLTYEGVEFCLVQELRGWAAVIPRFGKTMYFASQEEVVEEAVRLINAFIVKRVIRRLGKAA